MFNVTISIDENFNDYEYFRIVLDKYLSVMKKRNIIRLVGSVTMNKEHFLKRYSNSRCKTKICGVRDKNNRDAVLESIMYSVFYGDAAIVFTRGNDENVKYALQQIKYFNIPVRIVKY